MQHSRGHKRGHNLFWTCVYAAGITTVTVLAIVGVWSLWAWEVIR